MVQAYWNVDVDIIYLDTLDWEKRSWNLQKMMPDRNISKWNISRSNMKKCWCRHYYLVEHVEELLRQAEQEAGKKHGLDVWDELRLAHQTVQTRALLQTLHTQHAILREMKVRNINIGIDWALHWDPVFILSPSFELLCYTVTPLIKIDNEKISTWISDTARPTKRFMRMMLMRTTKRRIMKWPVKGKIASPFS